MTGDIPVIWHNNIIRDISRIFHAKRVPLEAALLAVPQTQLILSVIKTVYRKTGNFGEEKLWRILI